MALSKKDRAMLSGYILVDRKFHEAFIKNPKKAAKKLSVELTDKQHEEMLRRSREIKKLGQKSDKMLTDKVTLKPAFIEYIVLD